ncbi:MAG: hypothetical protein Q8L60_09275 [Gammaproteobacteria bacterium]|nr:hypothetical protein [Gammaproteobacteria bacterium]MDP2347437.1 hypothetical protein [Gammaproteobacteria bacterium]
MYKSLFFWLGIVLLSPACSDSTTSEQNIDPPKADEYLVFIGQKVSLEYVPPLGDELRFDSEYLANYRILELFLGNYVGSEIEFTVYDHYGEPPFSSFEHVLLYLEKYGDAYYHSKYQFSPVYKSRDGRWAGTYAASDYNHSYNVDTDIQPEEIDFLEPVTFDISQLAEDERKKWYPEPYFQIEDDTAIAVYGNYVEELFLLKQSGVLKARDDFQNF